MTETGTRDVLERIAELESRFDREVEAIEDRAGWEEVRVRWIGAKRGLIREELSRIGELAPEQRPAFGEAVNALKAHAESKLAALDEELEEIERRRRREARRVDVTLPGRPPRIGTAHPVTRVTEEIESIFAELGYSVAEGPEIETDFHNFQALNMPPNHPARDTQDTFFVEGEMVLRTHTSPVQIRTMLSREPPIRIICPGRVYRHDNDLRHSPMFHQVEGLCVGEGITFGDLKGTLEAFLTRLFSRDTGVRLRPSHFPFTEPSAEVDITCPFCAGEGCRVCSSSGWMEILGAGMVDPRVLRTCEIDPTVHSGFAFGLGLDRVAMIRYGIPNIRMLFDNDERLLRQIR